MQEITTYTTGITGTAENKFNRDQKKRLKDGWKLVNSMNVPRSLFTQNKIVVTWEKD